LRYIFDYVKLRVGSLGNTARLWLLRHVASNTALPKVDAELKLQAQRNTPGGEVDEVKAQYARLVLQKYERSRVSH